MLTTSPAAATPRQLAREIGEVRRQMDVMEARLAASTEPEERESLHHGLQIGAPWFAALEAQQAVPYQRRQSTVRRSAPAARRVHFLAGPHGGSRAPSSLPPTPTRVSPYVRPHNLT